ncbi:MAG: oligosaccharide flippase family protein [Bacteroidales bacterium]|jgi:O-antigen/teichoic acid export membrane protein|nr:oligosaccharide flippase family protein [Bacteroidales bacterium]
MPTKFLKSETFKNITFLVSSNVIGQGIGLLVYIFLARIYDTSDFGIFALFSSITGLLTIVATGRYEEAFVIAREKKDFYPVLGFTLKLLVGFNLFIFLILLLFRNSVFSLLKMESITDYWYMIPLTVFATGLFSILTYTANRDRKFKAIAASNILFNSLSSGFKIVLNYVSKAATGLIAGNLLGQFAACFSFFNLKEHLWLGWKIKWKYQKYSGALYKAFPSYNMTRGFINSFSANLPFLLLTGFFDASKLGLFSIALTLAFRPVNLLSTSLYRVFYERIVFFQHERKPIFKNVERYWQQLLLFGLPAFVAAYILIPFVFRLLFTEDWLGADTLFQLILPWMFMVLAVTPLGFIPIIFQKQKTSLWLEICYLALRTIVLLIGIFFDDFQLAILLFSLSGVGYMLATSIWYVFLMKKYEKEVKV